MPSPFLRGGVEQADSCASPRSVAVEFDGSPSWDTKDPSTYLFLFRMPLSKKTGEGINVCVHPDGQLIVQLIGDSWLDIDERKGCRGNGGIEGPI